MLCFQIFCICSRNIVFPIRTNRPQLQPRIHLSKPGPFFTWKDHEKNRYSNGQPRYSELCKRILPIGYWQKDFQYKARLGYFCIWFRKIRHLSGGVKPHTTAAKFWFHLLKHRLGFTRNAQYGNKHSNGGSSEHWGWILPITHWKKALHSHATFLHLISENQSWCKPPTATSWFRYHIFQNMDHSSPELSMRRTNITMVSQGIRNFLILKEGHWLSCNVCALCIWFRESRRISRGYKPRTSTASFRSHLPLKWPSIQQKWPIREQWFERPVKRFRTLGTNITNLILEEGLSVPCTFGHFCIWFWKIRQWLQTIHNDFLV